MTPSALHGATPCAGWDLEALLGHLGESLSALREGARTGHIELDPPAGSTEQTQDRLGDLRLVTENLLREWQRIPPSSNEFSISDRPLSITVVESVAAIELAVHGWDIFESGGTPCPIPEQLALALLPVSSLVVDESVRPLLFAAPISIEASACPSDRLVAFLGRRPRRPPPAPPADSLT